MKVYRIRDWLSLYENAETHRYKTLKWVPVPNSHEGEGYGQIMMMPDGSLRPNATDIFTAWIIMLQIASKCSPRGVLINANGKPYTAAGLAYKCKGNKAWFDAAIPLLLDIGWIENAEVQPAPAAAPEKPAPAPPAPPAAPAAADFYRKIIGLNFTGQLRDNALADFEAMPRLCEYRPDAEAVPEALLYCLEMIWAIRKKYPKFNIYQFMQAAVKRKHSITALAGAMHALMDLQKPEDIRNMAAYWQALMKNVDAQERCWRDKVWPAVKHGKYKLQ